MGFNSFGRTLILCLFQIILLGFGNSKSEVSDGQLESNISLQLGSLAETDHHNPGHSTSSEHNWRVINNGTGLLPIVKSELVLECLASVPVEWSITGHIKEPELIKIQPYRRLNSGSPLYFLKVIVFFLEEDSSSSSATFTCQRVGQPNDRKAIDIFYPGTTPLVQNDKPVTVLDSKVIPCPTTDPTIPVELLKVSPSGNLEIIFEANEKNSPIRYNPVVGFTLLDPAEGTYVCRTASDSVTVEARLSKNEIKEGYDFHPKNPNTKVFASEQVLLTCSSSNILSIVIDKVVGDITSLEKVNITIKRNGRIITSVVISSKTGAPLTVFAACIEKETGALITNWTVEFVEEPALYLDNFEGEVDCLSDYDDKSVSTVRCINPAHCEYMKRCFGTPGSCNFKRQKHFHSSYQTTCWVEKLQAGRNCSFLPYYHLNGIAQCTVQGLSKNWLFFTGLNYRKYTDWRDAPKDAIVKMEIRNHEMDKVAVCQAVSFLFAESLRFSYVFENGTEEFISSDKTKILGSESSDTMDELNYVAKVEDLVFPKDAVKIRCYAPWWNSTEYLSTEIDLHKQASCN